MSNLGRLVAEKELKAKIKKLTDYIERVSDEDLYNLLVVVDNLIEKSKPIKTERLNEKGKMELL